MTGSVTPKLELRDVGKRFRTRGHELVALTNVNLTVAAGEFLTIVGPSGCGKSTLVELIGGLTAPSSGQVLVDGTEVRGPGLDRGIVFQQYALLPWRTARRNIELGVAAKGVTGRRERRELAERYLEVVGLAGFGDRYPHELSGGMKQRVAIARSLAFDPAVLLMDEPFAALDAQTRESMQDELLRIWRTTGKTIVFITHGIEEAVYLGERVAVLTPRPGTVRTVVEVGSETVDPSVDDPRSTAAFGELRHRVWRELHTGPAEAATAVPEPAAVPAIA
jgi:NitT/TauT family transport system ATP-binding protein